MTSSGSDVSANAVNRRRSQNTTTISLRWLSRKDSSPELTTRSASWGERNRRSRPSRSSSCTWVLTRCSSSWFQAVSSAVCRSIVSWYRLIRTSDLTRASSSAWSNGLVTKSSAPASMACRFSWSPLAVIITTGRNSVRGSCRIRRQTSYPSRPGMKMSRRTRSGGSLGHEPQRLLPGLRRQDPVAPRSRARRRGAARSAAGRQRPGRSGPRSSSSSSRCMKARTCAGSARTLIGFSR